MRYKVYVSEYWLGQYIRTFVAAFRNHNDAERELISLKGHNKIAWIEEVCNGAD